MIKHIGQILAVTLSLVNMTIGYAASDSFTTDNIIAAEPASIVYLGTVDAEEEVTKLVTFLKNTKTPERFQLECDEQEIAKSCYYYASYHDLILKDYKQSYPYHKKAFDLGIKQAGYFIGVFQINYPELFTDDNRLSIDESIDYLEQAFEAGSPDATRILMMTYRDPKLNRVDFKKSEYYNKIAIKQNVKTSRFLLASLYINDMKDKSKIDESIELYKEDLIMEGNWQSALALMNIYLDPEKYGAKPEPNLVKTLAYAYVSSDLRDGRHEAWFNNVDTRFAEAMQTELSPETLKQARALYLEFMAKINSQQR